MRRAEVFVVDPSLFTLPYDHELCQALTRRGQSVRLVGRPLRPLERTVSAPDYRLEPVFYGRGDRVAEGSSLRGLLKGAEHLVGLVRLRRLVQDLRPRAVHFQWLAVAPADRLLLPALAPSTSLVLTAHDALAGGGRGFGALQRFGWRGAMSCFHHMVVHTEEGAAALRRQGVPARSIRVVAHPPLPLAPGPPPEPAHGADRVLVLFGEIKPYKGVDVAIEALSRLPAELVDRVRLVVAGRPRMPVAPLKRLAESLGVGRRVEWIDRYLTLDELPGVLARANAFLLPYRSADASGVLAQVLQLGRPIIASRTGALGEVVARSRCGILFRPGDATDLAAAIEGLLHDPRAAAAMGAAARREAARLPSWDEMAEAVTGLYGPDAGGD